MKNAIEYSQLKNYVNVIKENLSDNNVNDFFVKTSQILVNNLYDELWVRTPVRTGFLRRGFDVWNRPELEYWSVKNNTWSNSNLRKNSKNKFRLKDAFKQEQYKTNFSNIQPNKDKNKYSVYIRNPVYYAPYVEYGYKKKIHTSKSGTIKKEIKGRFYMKKSVEDLQEKTPEIVSKELNKLIRGK